MKARKYTEEQIIAVLKEGEAGARVADLCRKYGMSEATYYGRFRDECLNTNWFLNLRHAREVIEEWRWDYNEVRPHSSLQGATPKEYAEITVETLARGELILG